MACLYCVPERQAATLKRWRSPDPLQRIAPYVSRAEVALAGRGRVLVRPSGTEPLVRVMVEAPTEDEARQVAEELAAALAP